jgi:hypothetical protein
VALLPSFLVDEMAMSLAGDPRSVVTHARRGCTCPQCDCAFQCAAFEGEAVVCLYPSCCFLHNFPRDTGLCPIDLPFNLPVHWKWQIGRHCAQFRDMLSLLGRHASVITFVLSAAPGNSLAQGSTGSGGQLGREVRGVRSFDMRWVINGGGVRCSTRWEKDSLKDAD